MLNYSTDSVAEHLNLPVRARSRLWTKFVILAFPMALLALVAGCQTQKASSSSEDAAAMSKAEEYAKTDPGTNSNQGLLVLHEGDTLSISFPGAPDLNTVANIRRDGRVTLKSLGEFKAAGLTPPEMEQAIIKQFGPQLQTKEVSVAVTASAFPVYVTGAVLRPGKILSDRPITALEAVMEAGGFDYTKANLKAVRVLRRRNGRTEHFNVNLKSVLKGEESEQFNLQPSDILYVPEKFTLF